MEFCQLKNASQLLQTCAGCEDFSRSDTNGSVFRIGMESGRDFFFATFLVPSARILTLDVIERKDVLLK